jgi:hypothetical protein
VVPQTPFEWKAELGSAFSTAYNAQLGNVTYYVASRDYGHPAYLEVRGPRGGLKRLDLGNYHKIEQAKAEPRGLSSTFPIRSANSPG